MKLTIKNTLVATSFLVIAILVLTMNFMIGSKEDKSVVSADAQQNTGLPLKKAQEYVDYKLDVPVPEEGLDEASIHVATPPPEVTDKKAIKDGTRVEMFYPSKTNKDEGISVVTVGLKNIPTDPATGEPLKSTKIKIKDTEINFNQCDCAKDKSLKTYWWHNGEYSTEVTVYGEVKENKVTNLLKKLVK